MSALVHCIYTSVQARPLSEGELNDLVQHSRESNARKDLTGILLHVKGTFFQVLEGPQDVIEELYAKILVDRRHTRITKIIYEPIPRRYFSDSRMNLTTLSPAELAAVLDDKERIEQREQLLTGLDEGRAKRLLRAFTDGRWRSQTQPAPLPVPAEAVRA